MQHGRDFAGKFFMLFRNVREVLAIVLHSLERIECFRNSSNLSLLVCSLYFSYNLFRVFYCLLIETNLLIVVFSCITFFVLF